MEVSEDFTDFDCAPYWRKYASAGTIEQPYALVNGLHNARLEYDIRFHCTWTNEGRVSLSFAGWIESLGDIFFVKFKRLRFSSLFCSTTIKYFTTLSRRALTRSLKTSLLAPWIKLERDTWSLCPIFSSSTEWRWAIWSENCWFKNSSSDFWLGVFKGIG